MPEKQRGATSQMENHALSLLICLASARQCHSDAKRSLGGHDLSQTCTLPLETAGNLPTHFIVSPHMIYPSHLDFARRRFLRAADACIEQPCINTGVCSSVFLPSSRYLRQRLGRNLCTHLSQKCVAVLATKPERTEAPTWRNSHRNLRRYANYLLELVNKTTPFLGLLWPVPRLRTV